ncbi:MAG TPA: RDD family protein [Xanthobacteraceae bacterium]|nr:RDD family protein [Xanthobacteraceae bacterium]
MSDNEPKRIGVTIEVKPHAYDPATMPELFEGVLARRVVAFCIDLVLIATPALFVALFILVFGIVTLGLGWFFFLLYWPGVVVWALVYYAMGFGSPASATIGMRVMDLEMRTWYGAPAYALLGAVHAVVFWITCSALTPLILLVAFFNERRRLLHDMLVGTIVINNEVRTDALRGRRMG